MNTPVRTTRRAALVGALASTAILALPASTYARNASGATISALFSEWWTLVNRDTENETEEDFELQHARYLKLQRRITALRPASAREAAMQLVVETDNGGSDFREAFFRRVRRFAVEG